MPTPRPNLFSYATSELSQDAFLCWLLAWADPAHRGRDPDLHRVARTFLDALFVAADMGPPDSDARVIVHRQLKAADVVAEVGEDRVLIIEDKTTTENHSDQLDRYRKILGEVYKDRRLVCVYLKTGDQSSYMDVKSKDWAVFARADLLGVLRQGRDITHDVFIDFLMHLERVEARVNRYQTVLPCQWTRRDPAYRGLYLALQAARVPGDWKFVNNAAGGFHAFWWGGNKVDGGELYLQLEEHDLVVKVGVPAKERRRELRDRWCKRVTEGLDEFRRPRRLGYGRWMTVATYDGDYRVLGEDGLLDLDATVAHLASTATSLAALATW